MQNTQETIETLNDLIEINNDRIKGYEKAITDIEDDVNLKAIFTGKIKESHQFKLALAKEVEVLGADEATGTSFGGNLHRTWLDIKAKFTGHDSHSVLEECEFGEDAIKKAYDEAIQNENLPAFIKDILSDQLDILITSHDEIKELRDSAV